MFRGRSFKGVQEQRLELVSPCGVAMGLGEEKRSSRICFRWSNVGMTIFAQPVGTRPDPNGSGFTWSD